MTGASSTGLWGSVFKIAKLLLSNTSPVSDCSRGVADTVLFRSQSCQLKQMIDSPTYHGIAVLTRNRFVAMFALTARVCAGQVFPAHQVLIHLPPALPSERVFIRYVLSGEKFGGWVQPRSGVSSYEVSTAVGTVPATRFKAVVYAPGCALQTVDIRLSTSKNEEYSFLCTPLQSIWVNGTVIQSGPLYRHGVDLEARYIARWARGFLGLEDDSVLVIPVGEMADLSNDGRFRISVTDLFRDPLAGAPDGVGELQIWAKDKVSQNLLAQLIPAAGNATTRMGGLKIEREYPAEVTFVPCAITRSPLQDEKGFAQRSDVDGCDHQNRPALRSP